MWNSVTSVLWNTCAWEQQDWNNTKKQRNDVRRGEWIWKDIQCYKKIPDRLPNCTKCRNKFICHELFIILPLMSVTSFQGWVRQINILYLFIHWEKIFRNYVHFKQIYIYMLCLIYVIYVKYNYYTSILLKMQQTLSYLR